MNPRGLLDNFSLASLSARHKSLNFRPGIERRPRDAREDEPRYRWINGEWVKR